MFLVRRSVVVVLLFISWGAQAQVSKGFQILTNRGFQVQGMISDFNAFHLTTYSNANYSAMNWIWDSTPSAMGPAPGFPWARWARNESETPPLGSESSYLSQLMMIQLGDEWELNDDTTRTRLVNWFNSIRTNWPNTILYHNNYGGQVGDAQLFDFYSRAQPDLLCFDSYPFRVDGNGVPYSTIANWYSDLRRYREHAKGAGIPLGTYLQTYYSSSEGTRSPSASELRVQHSVAQAFNAKVLIDFTYNSGSSSLFVNSSDGDNVPTALYAEKADCALRARNLGKTLVRLKPVPEVSFPDLRTTSMMFIRGRDPNGNLNPFPIGFYAGPGGGDVNTDWAYQRNDPYLANWTVTNKGTKNNGQPGDVIVSWFNTIDESLDGTNYSNEVYLMVVNALNDTNGSPADCKQEIKMNFADAFLAIESLNPATGLVQVQALPLTNGFRQLVLTLNGGDATLFKFSDGAPFIGASLTGSPVITSQPQNQTNNAGTDAAFSARAAGGLPISYQWKFNGTNVAGATTNTLARTSVQLTNAGSYTLVASNSFGSATSSIATLTVYSPPQIYTQPQSRTVAAGSNVLFTVSADGNPAISYQWRFNGTNISGATTSSYTRINAQSIDAGTYNVIVSNSGGNLLSSNALLIVNGAPAITAQPQNRAVLTGTSASFSVSAVGTGPLFYGWKKDGNNLSDGGATSGATTSSITLSSVQQSDTGTYTVIVSNAYGATLSAPATLSIAVTPTIQIQPQNRTTNGGSTVTFSVVASGGGLGYQWRRTSTNMIDGGNISGSTTDTLTLSTVSKSDATSYTVVITNAAGSVTSSAATLTLTFPLPWHDPFNYNAGDNLGGQTTPNGLIWNDIGTGTAGAYITIDPSNLIVTNLASSFGNSMRFGGLGKSVRLSFPSAFNSGTVYASFAFKVLDLTGLSSSGAFIGGFNNSTGTQTTQPSIIGTRIYLRATNSGFNLGVAKNSDTDWYWDTNLYNANQTIFLVGSYTFGNVAVTNDDVSKLWINPDPTTFGAASPPSATLTAATGTDINGSANQAASFVLVQRASTEPAAMIVDSFRISTNWAGVTPRIGAAHIDSVSLLADGRLRLQASGDPGNVTVEMSSDLSGWTTLSNISSTSGTFEFIEASASQSRRFYRIRVSP